jgi:hypothetical protein
VVAALFVTSEYRRGLIRTKLAASPRRGRVVLAAKAVVIGAVSAVIVAVVLPYILATASQLPSAPASGCCA